MKINHSNISAFLFAMMLITNISTGKANSISDVSKSDSRYTAIESMIENNAFTLDSKNRFRPNERINKAAFIKASFAYKGFTPSPMLNYVTPFFDVPEESWFAPYVKKALEARIIFTSENKFFSPDANMNRQEALLILTQLFGIPTPFEETKKEDLFDDIRPTRYFSHIYKAAKQNGIVFSEDPNLFKPAKLLNRADAAELIYKSKNAGMKSGGIITVIQEKSPSTNLKSISGVPESLKKTKSFEVFIDSWERINNEYINKNTIDREYLVYGAIEGMVNRLGDPYSSFYAPDQYGNQIIIVPENYVGIGAFIELINDKYTIQGVFLGSPAEKAGLRIGDIIMEIDGKSVNGISPENLIKMIKGQDQTRITMRITRDSNVMDITMKREKINMESIQGRIMDSEILYIQINQFTQDGHVEFENVLKNLNHLLYDKMIIDLRNNPGGFVSSTQEILGRFIEKGEVIFEIQTGSNYNEKFYSEGPADLKNFKTIVLINRDSASSAEIMAAALKENKQAILVGERTHGKDSIQEIIEYTDNSALKLTIAKWFTPLKNDVKDKGVIPDNVVVFNRDMAKEDKDNQLEFAISLLK